MAAKINQQFRNDFLRLSTKELEAKYNIGSNEIEDLKKLKGQELEDRISKLRIGILGH